mgnify:CR=1 FL=1
MSFFVFNFRVKENEYEWKINNFLNPYIYLFKFTWTIRISCNISLFDFVWNRDILHAIYTVQEKLNRYIHEFKKKLFVHMINKGMKKVFYKIWRIKKLIFMKCEGLWIGLCKF